MTGAGAGSLAFAKESSFATLPSDPTYYQFGRDVQVTEATLDNQLERLRDAGAVEAAESIARNAEGGFTAEAAMSSDVFSDVLDLVFDGSGSFSGPAAPSGRVFLGVEMLGGPIERELIGCIPTEFTLQYQQSSNTIRHTLAMAYGEEEHNTSITPTSPTGPTDGSTVPFHGFELTVDGNVAVKEDTASLTISNIARFHRGSSRTPADAVLANPQTTLDLTATLDTQDNLQLAYGGSAASSIQDAVDGVSGSVVFSNDAGTVSTATLPTLTVTNYGWSNPIAPDDAAESVSWNVDGGVSFS